MWNEHPSHSRRQFAQPLQCPGMAGPDDVGALATRLHLHVADDGDARRGLASSVAAFVHAPTGGLQASAGLEAAGHVAAASGHEDWAHDAGEYAAAPPSAGYAWPPVFASPTTNRPASKLPMAAFVSERDSPASRVAYPVTAIMRTRGVGEWPRGVAGQAGWTVGTAGSNSAGALPTASGRLAQSTPANVYGTGGSTGGGGGMAAGAGSATSDPADVNLAVPSLSVPPPIVKHSVAFSGLAALAGQSGSMRRGLAPSSAPGATSSGRKGW